MSHNKNWVCALFYVVLAITPAVGGGACHTIAVKPCAIWFRWLCFILLLALPLAGFSATPHATPQISDIEYPDDSPPSGREVALGKLLFFDHRLSGDNRRSCASCHNPDLGFSDGLKSSIGVDGKPLPRNTPPIYNLAWNTVFFWDGRANSLEEQALMPIVSEAEMNMPLDQLAKRLQTVGFYRKEFRALYGNPAITPANISRALGAYMRTLISDNAPFDRYLQGEKHAMSPAAIRGLALFDGKAKCNQCHDGANFTDESFHSLGLEDNDLGRGAIIDDDSLNYRFKTPGLRNVTLTYPYMHNGSLPDLEAVIRFYNQGGGNAKHKDKLITPLGLSEQEIADLIAFLGALESPLKVTRPKLPKQ